MPTILFKRVVGLAMSAGALGLGACAATHGVEVYNDTGQVVRAEMLSVNPRGESNLYSTAVVNKDAFFENRMTEAVNGQTMRVRFTLIEQSADDNNWVMLNLPPGATRTYSLKLDGGRLRAEEYKRAKPRE